MHSGKHAKQAFHTCVIKSPNVPLPSPGQARASGHLQCSKAEDTGVPDDTSKERDGEEVFASPGYYTERLVQHRLLQSVPSLLSVSSMMRVRSRLA